MNEMYLNGFYGLEGDVSPEELAAFIPPRRLRRIEKLGKNVLYCACRACTQAGADIQTPKTWGLSVAADAGSLESTCKFMDTIIEDGDELSSPTAFASSVHNSTGLMLSMFLHLSGPCVTSGQFDFSFAAAWLSAAQFLRRGMCEQALVAVAEDLNPVAADQSPAQAEQFKPVLRAPQGPFVRRAAAFVLSQRPTEHTLFCLRRFAFARTEKPAALSPQQTNLSGAQRLVACLKTKQPFAFTDAFADAFMQLEGTPYVN